MSPVQICWKCGVTKGSADDSMCYINLHANAPWRGTSTTAWNVRPEFANVAPKLNFAVSVQLYMNSNMNNMNIDNI